jgi:UDP-glucose:(heptosyl)LPS alpha-1,3-glucosyltransferase
MSLHVALFVRTYSGYGGVESVCRSFLHYLKEQSIPARLYCGFDRTDEADPDVVRLPVLRGSRALKTWSYWRSALRARRGLPAGTVSMAFATVPGCDVFRSGGLHLDYVVKSLRAYASTGSRMGKSLRRAASPVNWLQPLLDRRIYAHPGTRRIIAISSLMAGEIAARHPEAASRTVVVPNGVDAGRFNLQTRDRLREQARRELGLGPGEAAVGFCSTNMELKGLAHLIRSLPHCPSGFQVVVASGRRPDRFRALAREHGVEDRVRFLGRVEDMASFYAGLDVLCHPSAYDTFGNVVPEALAMGVPVAATPWVGAKDLIRPGENGEVLDPCDPQRLAGALQRCAALPAREFAGEVPDMARTFARYLEILEQAAQAKTARGTQ